MKRAEAIALEAHRERGAAQSVGHLQESDQNSYADLSFVLGILLQQHRQRGGQPSLQGRNGDRAGHKSVRARLENIYGIYHFRFCQRSRPGRAEHNLSGISLP